MITKLFKIVLVIFITAPLNLFAVGIPTINAVTVGTVTGTTAVINTTVWPNGQATALSIQYSLLNNNFVSGALGTISMGTLAAGLPATAKTITLTGLTPSKQYFFRIIATNNSGTDYAPNSGGSTFSTTTGVAYVLAQITNVSSTVLSGTSAQIDFSIVPSNTTSVWLQYSTNPTFTTGLLTQTLASIPAGTVAVPVSTTLTALSPATKYYYRVRTQNSVGDNYSPNSNFFSTFGAPLIYDITSSVISNTAAKINYSLDPNGASSSSVIEYSTDLTYSNSKTASTVALLTNTSAFLSGLNAGATYNYRIKATNIVGTTTSTVGSISLTNTNPSPAIVAEFKFNNTYSSEVGNIPFISNSKTSFTYDRNSNPYSALNLADTSCIASIPSLPSGGLNRSISVWVKLNTLKTNNPLFVLGALPDFNQVYFSSSNVLLERDATTKLDISSSSFTGEWYHYVQTFDGSTAKIYRNGALLGQAAGDYFTTLNSQIFMLGRNSENTAKLDGAVDDLKIFNYVLNPTQVNELYLNDKLPTGSNSVISNGETLQIYPNPASDYITFIDKDKFKQKNIIDFQGKVVLETSDKQISISHLPTGIYLVKYINSENQIGYTKLIKR